MLARYHQKKQRKNFKKGSWKAPESSWRRKRQKVPICSWKRNMSEEEQKKKPQYDRERYKNLLDDAKQRLVEYIKNKSRMQKKILAEYRFLKKIFFVCLRLLNKIKKNYFID